MLLALMSFVANGSVPWYLGAGGGASSLRPDTENSPFSVDSDVSYGGGIFAGYDYSERFSFELGYNFLGQAIVRGPNGKNSIDYSALSAGALFYWYGDDRAIAERNGLTSYLRFGVNSMRNSTSIPLDREDNVGIWAGLGVEWPINPNLSLRGEVASFDGDAQTAWLSVLYRPRAHANIASAVRLPEAPKPSSSADPTNSSVQQGTPAESTGEQAVFQPAQSAIALDSALCTEPQSHEPIDEQGCALFGGTLNGVSFAAGTANLLPNSLGLLDTLSDNLLRYPSIQIEIQADTESFSDEAFAKDIAKQRTIAVARHLAKRGVPIERLKARAFGHSRPLVSEQTDAGRQQNNRIQLLVLPK